MKQLFIRNGELILWGVLLFACLWLIVQYWGIAHWILLAAFFAFTAIPLIGFWNAWQKQRLLGKGGGQGIVRVDERRVEYFGPLNGGIVDLDRLQKLEISGQGPTKRWILHHVDGPPLTIFRHVEGADALLDVFSGFAGLSLSQIGRALEDRSGKSQILWEKPKGRLN